MDLFHLLFAAIIILGLFFSSDFYPFHILFLVITGIRLFNFLFSFLHSDVITFNFLMNSLTYTFHFKIDHNHFYWLMLWQFFLISSFAHRIHNMKLDICNKLIKSIIDANNKFTKYIIFLTYSCASINFLNAIIYYSFILKINNFFVWSYVIKSISQYSIGYLIV